MQQFGRKQARWFGPVDSAAISTVIGESAAAGSKTTAPPSASETSAAS
jgi:hypothetical protein